MGSWQVIKQSFIGFVSGLRLGRRSAARADWSRLVPEEFRQPSGSRPLRRPMLVAGPDELGELAPARPDTASKLVAGALPGGLPSLGNSACPGSGRLFAHLSNGRSRSQEPDWLGV